MAGKTPDPIMAKVIIMIYRGMQSRGEQWSFFGSDEMVIFLAVQDSSIGDLVTQSVRQRFLTMTIVDTSRHF